MGVSNATRTPGKSDDSRRTMEQAGRSIATHASRGRHRNSRRMTGWTQTQRLRPTRVRATAHYTRVRARNEPKARNPPDETAGLRNEGRGSRQRSSNELIDWGIAPERVVIEDQSRNTRENAVESARVARERGWKTILVVTSAFHMERALGCFRAVGLEVDALPVDQRGYDPGWQSWLPRVWGSSHKARTPCTRWRRGSSIGWAVTPSRHTSPSFQSTPSAIESCSRSSCRALSSASRFPFRRPLAER